MFRGLATHTRTNLSATAATVITALIPPRIGCKTRVTSIDYRCAGTAHTITMLKALGSAVLTANVAASGTSITLDAAPVTSNAASGVLANSDWVAIQMDNGEYFLSLISGLSTLTMTVSAIPYAASAGNRVWTFGVPGDHTSSLTQSQTAVISGQSIDRGSQFVCTASVLNSWKDTAGGLCVSINQNDPIMIHSNNATAAGTFELISATHTQN